MGSRSDNSWANDYLVLVYDSDFDEEDKINSEECVNCKLITIHSLEGNHSDTPSNVKEGNTCCSRYRDRNICNE